MTLLSSHFERSEVNDVAPENMSLWGVGASGKERRASGAAVSGGEKGAHRDAPHGRDLAHVPLREIRGKRRRIGEHAAVVWELERAAKSAERQVLR